MYTVLEDLLRYDKDWCFGDRVKMKNDHRTFFGKDSRSDGHLKIFMWIQEHRRVTYLHSTDEALDTAI